MIATPPPSFQNPQAQENLFKEWLATQSVELSLPGFLINLALAIALASLLALVYVKYGRSLSNRKLFARNFWALAAGTMLIITIVKSSLALSLGLVGALSIVRFRAAIKEPEELIYLFFAISIGLGLGADQATVTIATILIVSVVLAASNYRRASDSSKSIIISIVTKEIEALTLDAMAAALQAHCAVVVMKRFDEAENTLEASFLVEIDSFDELNAARGALRSLDEGARITFLDNKGLL